MRVRLYYWLFDFLTSSLFARIFGRFYGLRSERVRAFQVPIGIEDGPELGDSIWFHAASVGELEMLMPILERGLELGLACSVSAFSDSALLWINRLRAHKQAGNLRYIGLSPRDRDWKPLWKELRVKRLWIAKYDFWPGMWEAAAELGIEVMVINARYRPSLARLQQFMKLLGVKPPILGFYCSNSEMIEPLKKHFPFARVTPAPDPRRVRIRERAENMNPQAERIKDKIATLPRPIGIVGSAWASDLEMISCLTETLVRGSIVVFPHSFETKNLKQVKAALTEVARAHPVQTMMIEEKGVLLECYSAASYVWVGGGFGHGIHSTLEPAFYGLPLVAGSVNAEKFDEISELVRAKQLTLCEEEADVTRWFRDNPSPKPAGKPLIPFPTQKEFVIWVDPLLVTQSGNKLG
ncbi:MAG: hypothetical protein JST80_05610 [Bdellovibrionales bacterium]|nr:hypothetical protein [Bdellovibrionales bacterium]